LVKEKELRQDLIAINIPVALIFGLLRVRQDCECALCASSARGSQGFQEILLETFLKEGKATNYIIFTDLLHFLPLQRLT